MGLKTRNWFLLSLVLFLAAAWFWRLGDRQVARRLSAPAAATNAANAAAVGQPFVLKITNDVVPLSVEALLATVTSNAPNVKVTNLFAYRLSNTRRPLAELARSDRALLLRNVLLDTANPARPEIPEHLRAQGDPGAYIVQARGAITSGFRAWLEQAGAEIVSYVPNNAFLVRAPAGVMGSLRGSGQVQAVVPLEPYYKLDSLLLPLAVERQFSPHEFLNVVSFPRAAAAAQAQLEKLGAQVVRAPEPTVFGDVLMVKAPANALAAMAQIREVQLIGVHVEKRTANDLSRVKLRVSTDTTNRPPPSHYGAPRTNDHLTGLGVLVGVNDTGADATHPDLINRVLGPYAVSDFDGHGTHVIGTLIGDGSASPLMGPGYPTNAMGSRTQAVFSGLAPRATAYVQDFRGPDALLQRRTALTNALISNNSWGYPVNDYDIFAASYDAAVRDSLPGVTGEQEVAYVFAAGNDGGGDGQGLNGIAGSVLSPATAKNVISVGAADLPRFISNEVFRACHNETVIIIPTSGPPVTNIVVVCETNRPWWPMTDSASQVAPFSSRGNVGIGIEGPSGRFKPDVVAPGAMVGSARSKDFQEQSNSLSTFVYRYNFVPAPFKVTNLFTLNIPANAINVTIEARTNVLSPTNMDLLIGADIDAVPVGFLGTNFVSLITNGTPPLRAGTLFYTIANLYNSNTINFDLVVLVTVTNDVGNYYQVLSDINQPLKPSYRYEYGTSMAAPQIAGLLALFQEYLGTNFSLRPSPALLKALVINGARSLSPSYNLDTHAAINHQGWGVANISNSIPAGLNPVDTNGPMRFFDQGLTNALITGASNVYQITVPDEARSHPLRVTLVWTDPPGNPLAGVKLVNDLNLTLEGVGTNAVQAGTNAVDTATTNLYLGNNFPPGSDFTDPIIIGTTDTNLPAVTNLAQTVEQVRDYVNNVENVYIRPPLAASYTVVVKGHRVNVNALNSYTNNPGRDVAQDYALVIASGNVAPSNNVNLAVTGPTVFASDNSNRLAALLRATNANTAGLFNQRVGANSALIVTTNGTTNQWCFFLYTNSLNTVVQTGQYVAIFTFFTPELSLPRVREADIDLYVARSSVSPTAGNLLALDPNEVAVSIKSTSRGGSELVIFTNATVDEVFYIGVKSEDQQAAQFNIYAVSSDSPFSSGDGSNDIVVSFFPVPMPIPDGEPDAPGGTNLFAIVDRQNVLVQRVFVTNAVYHEEAGDLIGILSHRDSVDGSDAAVTLNNHRFWNGLDVSVYDDSDQGDLPWAIPPDGPGTLRSFVGQQAFGVWNYAISDNTLVHTGEVRQLTLAISPASTNTDQPVNLVRRIPAGRWIYAAFPVTVDVTNIHACAGYEGAGTGPVELYLRRGDFPDRILFDKGLTNILPPGPACLDLGLNDNPPISPGRYYVGVYNAGPDPAVIRLTVDLQRGLNPNAASIVASTNRTDFIDDATTNATLFVTNRGLVASVEVDVRIDHPRVADLALHLVSPTGVRTLLAENRGRDTPAGYGWTVSNIVVTNFGARVLDNSFEEGPFDERFGIGTVFSGWRVERGDIDSLTGNIKGPADTGVSYPDLNGTIGGGLISTNVATTVGRKYLLTFAFTKSTDSSGPGFIPSATADLLLNSNQSLRFTYNFLNSVANVNWAHTSFVFQATSTVTKVSFAQVTPPSGIAGMFIDTVRMDEVEIVTNSTLYATFTDDPAKAIWPIKFAPPPFGETNFTGTNIFISGFEGTNYIDPILYPTRNRLTNGQAFNGWTVTSNHVFLQTNSALAYSDTNFLFLRTGVVARVLPTEIGREYTLRFATRTARRGIYSTGVDQDDVPLLLGELDSHYYVSSNFSTTTSNRAWTLQTNAIGATWFQRTNGASRWIGIDPVLLAPGTNAGLPAYTYRTHFNLRALETNAVLQGQVAADDSIRGARLNGSNIAFVVNAPAYNGFAPFTISSGFRAGQNRLEFILDNWVNRPDGTSPHGFRAEFKHDALQTPVITFDQIPLPGIFPLANSGYAGLQWSNLYVLNGTLQAPSTGYYSGRVSPDNVAFNSTGGGQASISRATPFNLKAGYFTAVYTEPTTLIVRGFVGTTQVYANTNTLNRTGPTLITFDYQGVTRVTFDHSHAVQGDTTFAMDNLIIDTGLAPRIYSSVGQVKLVGCYTNYFTALSDNWRIENVTFVARSTNTVLEFTGVTPSVWLDHIQMRETGRKYYLPEESLTPFIGQPTFGNWNLELWDSRLGAVASNANLISWRLNMTYVRTNPPFVLLTNAVSFGNIPAARATVGTNAVRYFAFDVACDGGEVTNILRSLTLPYALDLIFNQGTFPLTGASGDYLLLQNVTNDTNILFVGAAPLLNKGRYFLAVRNTNAVPVDFEIFVGMDTNCTASAIPDLFLGKTVSFGPGGATFTWSASPSSTFSVLYADDPAGPWIELPDPISSGTGEFSFTDNGSATGGLSSPRFYRIRLR